MPAPTRDAATPVRRSHKGVIKCCGAVCWAVIFPDKIRLYDKKQYCSGRKGRVSSAGFLSGLTDHYSAGGLCRPGARYRQRNLQIAAGNHRRQWQLVLRADRRHHSDGRQFSWLVALRRDQARPRSFHARLLQPHLVCHAVFGRYGHWLDVLRRGRAGHALPVAAGGRSRHGRSGPCGDEDHLLPLGSARLGDLRHRGADPRLLQLPPRPAAHAALGAVSDDWRAHLRPHRPCGRHFCRHRHGVWRGHLAGLRRHAGQCRPQSSVRHSGQHHGADRAHHRCDRAGHAVGGHRSRQGHQDPV